MQSLSKLQPMAESAVETVTEFVKENRVAVGVGAGVVGAGLLASYLRRRKNTPVRDDSGNLMFTLAPVLKAAMMSKKNDIETVVTQANDTFRATLKGKIAIVTGCNTGIGWDTARGLAMLGCHVIMAGRSMERLEAAKARIEAQYSNVQLTCMHCDLADLYSVEKFVREFLAMDLPLHILVNNAGLMCDGKTKQGLELMMGVNHVGPFHLTMLLLEKLKASKPARVVNVSSIGHKCSKMAIETAPRLFWERYGTKIAMDQYCNTKLCNVLFTNKLARDHGDEDLLFFSCHPGAVQTDITRNSRALGLLWILSKPILKTSSQGAATTLHCAVLADAKQQGEYFGECDVEPKNPVAVNAVSFEEEVWRLTEAAIAKVMGRQPAQRMPN